MNQIVSAFEITYSQQNNGEAIKEASEFLCQMSERLDYIQILFSILSDFSLDPRIRTAASIQFKHKVLSSKEILVSLQLDQLMNVIFQNPPLVQLQLISILNPYIAYIVLIGHVSDFLTFIKDHITINSNFDFFFSILIMNGLLHIQSNIVPCYGTFDQLISNLVPYYPIILQKISSLNPFDSDLELMFHCTLLMVNKLANYCPPDPLPDWIECLIRKLSLFFTKTPNTKRNLKMIDKDIVKVLSTIFEVHFLLLSPEISLSVTDSLCNYLEASPSSQTISYIFRTLRISLPDPKVSSTLSPYISNILNLFLTQFIPDEEYLSMIDDDPFQFISHYHITYDSDQPMCDVINTLNRFVNAHPELIHTILQIIIPMINHFPPERAFGAFLFIAYSFQLRNETLLSMPNLINEKFINDSINVISQVAAPQVLGYIKNNFNDHSSLSLYVSGFFAFLSLVKNNAIEDPGLLETCLYSLISNDSDIIVQYFAAAAATNLLPYFLDKEDSISIRASIAEQLPLLMPKIFSLSHEIETDSMLNTVTTFSKYFSANLIPMAIPSVHELFYLLNQCWNENDSIEITSMTANLCQDSIESFSNLMSTQPQELSEPFFIESGTICITLLSQTKPIYHEGLLQILTSLLKNTPVLYEPYQQIPNLIMTSFISSNPKITSGEPFDENDELDNCKLIAILFKYMVLKASGPMSQPEFFSYLIQFAEIVATLTHQQDCHFAFTLVSQLIFVVLGNTEIASSVVPKFLDMIDSAQNPYLGDAIAAIATTDPIPILSEQTRFNKWLGAQPSAFLRSVMTIIQRLGNSAINQQIAEKMIENLQRLKDIEACPNQEEDQWYCKQNSFKKEDSEIFNKLVIIEFIDNYILTNHSDLFN